MTSRQSEGGVTDSLQKASLISERKQNRSRLNGSLILRHEAQNPASVLRSSLRQEA